MMDVAQNSETDAVRTTTTVQPAAHRPEAEKSGPSALLRPDPGLVVWTWLIFFALLLFFRKFGLGPLISSMEERENLISSAIEDAKATKRKMAEIEAERDRILAAAEDKRSEIIRKARKRAEETAQSILDDAKRSAGKIIDDAKEEIDRERRAALIKLKDDIVDISLTAASKVVDREMDDDDNRRFLDDVVKELSV